jgi:DNA-binding response OmpR family regulator
MQDYTILLVDYDPDSAARLCRPLIRAGYRVEVATDGLAGISRFHELNPDLTLIEAMIPKKHGFEVCQELKRTEHGQSTQVWILTSVYKGRKYRTQAFLHYKCDQYLEKPISEDELMASVNGYFEERSRLTEAQETVEAGQGTVTSFDPDRRRASQADPSDETRLLEITATGESSGDGGARPAVAPEIGVPAPAADPLPSEVLAETEVASVPEVSEAPKRSRLLLWIALVLLVVLGGLLAVTVLL